MARKALRISRHTRTGSFGHDRSHLQGNRDLGAHHYGQCHGRTDIVHVCTHRNILSNEFHLCGKQIEAGNNFDLLHLGV